MSKSEDTSSMRSTTQRVRMIHYFYYTEYNKLVDLGFHFNAPRKERNTYISYLQNPIYFTLPKSEILEIYECNVTQENRLKYVVDAESRSDLVKFLENLDRLCIDLSYKNSNNWFKKAIDKEVLQESYYSLYGEDKDEDNENVMEIVVDKEALLDHLVDYNRSETLNLMVCIKGIEFFKSRFKWYITLEKLVTIPNVTAVQKKKTVAMDESDSYVSSSDEDSDSDHQYESDSDDFDMDKRGGYSKDDKELSSTTVDLKSSVHKMSRGELEKYIREKSEESKKLFLNSERVRKTADIIYQRAMQLQNEVSRCKELLRSRNE